MNIKKCSKCGWVYPGAYEGRQCKFCKTIFSMGYCRLCGEWSDNIYDGACRACNTKDYNKWLDDKKQIQEDAFSRWLAMINKIPKPYKTLTEEEWLEACRHFKGCAFCKDDRIDAREMFIQFDNGGRYCSWNIVPACEACATRRKGLKNPFSRMDNQVNRQKNCTAKKYDLTKENLQDIVDYLRRKMEVILNE